MLLSVPFSLAACSNKEPYQKSPTIASSVYETTYVFTDVFGESYTHTFGEDAAGNVYASDGKTEMVCIYTGSDSLNRKEYEVYLREVDALSWEKQEGIYNSQLDSKPVQTYNNWLANFAFNDRSRYVTTKGTGVEDYEAQFTKMEGAEFQKMPEVFNSGRECSFYRYTRDYKWGEYVDGEYQSHTVKETWHIAIDNETRWVVYKELMDPTEKHQPTEQDMQYVDFWETMAQEYVIYAACTEQVYDHGKSYADMLTQ